MESIIPLEIEPQPDDTTCGPTCLHSVYRAYGDEVELEDVIRGVRQLETGGTLAVLLGTDALRRGYRAAIYTYNLDVFDPTWFDLERPELCARLRERASARGEGRLADTARAYEVFLAAGGEIRFRDLSAGLIREHLHRGHPILTGLSATYLYRSARESGQPSRYDDLRGDPQGHFVVLCGYSPRERSVLVADPLQPNPIARGHHYEVRVERLVCAILLGVLTYDANLLIIRPRDGRGSARS